jgi:membrane protein DedA with SNARE-associated domain
MLDSVATYVQHVIESMGYGGLFLLIVLESTLVPVPSMLVMPFAGFLASRGTFSLPAILAINAAGALTGSLISYVIGAAGGKPLLLRYGKYVMVRPDDLRKTEEYFARHGAWTVLIARFLPVVRHLISIPAGIARMKLPTFLLQTFLGASIWGGGLMVIGYQIGENWRSFSTTAKRFDLVIAGLVVLTILALAVRFWRRRRAQRQPGVGETTRSVGS